MTAACDKEILLRKLRSGTEMSRSERISLTLKLAIPAILAQLSMCLMSYIDAAMVGRLGSIQAAAVGLVSTSTWIFGSFCHANSSGYSVQIAHKCGAGEFEDSRRIFRYGFIYTVTAALLLAVIGTGISGALPVWLGGSEEISRDASSYFLIYALFLPVLQIAVFSEAALIASGNMKVPSMVSLAMCVLDVFFNYLFIFVLGMGVRGAALGTGISELCAGLFLLWYGASRSGALKQSGISRLSSPKRNDLVLRQAFRITWPLWLQNLISRGAYIAATVLVAPLGTVAIAANSFAIIAEGFCYLPGYGMSDAATTLVGQSLGAGRKDMAKSFARITIFSGASVMTLLAVLMFIFASPIMGMLSSDEEVISLGASCLRIEAFAELLYGVSIVAYGCCVGAGDTLVPSAINLMSMWVIRIGLALFLIPRYGLVGYWIAMAVELSVKGLIFAFRIKGERWMKHKIL